MLILQTLQTSHFESVEYGMDVFYLVALRTASAKIIS